MKSLDYFADSLLGRIDKNFDNVIIVDSGGVKGPGKSTWSIKLSKKICLKIGYKYSYKLIIFNPTSEKIVNKVKTLPEGCPIHIDETTLVAYKRDFQKEFAKKLIKFINICRKFKKVVIFNNPDFWDLDKDLRNLADYRVTILKRGMSQIRGKYANPEVEDKWLRKQSMEIIDHHIKSDPTSIDNVIAAIRKTPNYLYDIPFTPLKDKEYGKYERLSKIEELKSIEKNIDVWRLRFVALTTALINDGFEDAKLTSIDIAKKTNRLISSYARFHNYQRSEPLMISSSLIRKKIQTMFGEKGGRLV